jgi:hypothetical protein
MSRLQLQNVDKGVPIKDASCIGVLGNDGLKWLHRDGLNWAHLRPIVA